jgi:hypothetical protein
MALHCIWNEIKMACCSHAALHNGPLPVMVSLHSTPPPCSLPSAHPHLAISWMCQVLSISKSLLILETLITVCIVITYCVVDIILSVAGLQCACYVDCDTPEGYQDSHMLKSPA